MNKERPSLGALLAIVVFALSCFLLLLFLWRTFGGTTPLNPEGYRISAVYREAVLLPVEADVRISGVSVGSVKRVERDGRLSRVDIEIDERFAPLPKDTKTVVRRKTLLGEAYLELAPGTPVSRGGEPLPEGGRLPLGQSKPTVELDEFLRAFDDPTRRHFKAILEELAIATGDMAPELSAASASFGPAFDDANRLAEIVRGQRADLRGLVRDSGAVLDAFSAQPGALRALVENSNAVLSATAAEEAALSRSIEEFPAFLDQLRPTLTLAREVGDELDPLLDEAEPAVGDLPPTLRDLRAAAPEVEGLARDLETLIDSAEDGLPALESTLAVAGPLVDQLDPTLRDLVPAADHLRLYRRELASQFAKLAATLEATSGKGDKAVHMLRAILLLKPEGLGIYQDKLPSNRHNPYPKPGQLDKVGSPHMDAFDCLNAADSSQAPACTEQGDWRLEGDRMTFPRLRRDPGRPGGPTPRP